VCPTYTSEVLDNASTSVESDLYANMKLPDVAKQVGEIINASDWQLSNKDVQNLWKACQFEASISNNTGKFCSLFNKDRADILNYVGDLSSYYEKGYAYPIDYTISCVLMKSMVNAIDQVIADPVDVYSQRANLRFAHAETIMPIVAALGLYKDSKPLLHNSPDDVIATRLWRGSVIAPYASNVAFVTYNCSSASSPMDFRVRLLVSEKEMQFPGCGAVYCPLKTLKTLYESALTCNFDQMCGIKNCSTDDNGNNADDDEWTLTSKMGIAVAAAVFVVGLVLGMIVTGSTILFTQHVKKQKAYRAGYGVLGRGGLNSDSDSVSVIL